LPEFIDSWWLIALRFLPVIWAKALDSRHIPKFSKFWNVKLVRKLSELFDLVKK
jgi:hypothetical protein